MAKQLKCDTVALLLLDNDNDNIQNARAHGVMAVHITPDTTAADITGTHGQYYSNGVCPNKDAKTDFAYRLVTGGFDCNLCDEKCQADIQARREQHKNDSSFAIYQVKDNDKIIAVYKMENSPVHAPVITEIPLATAPDKPSPEFPMFFTFSKNGWDGMVAHLKQKERDDTVTKRLAPISILITYVVKRNGAVVGTYKVGEMQDGTREILPPDLSANLYGVMMQTIETTEPGWNNIQSDIARQAAKRKQK